MDARSLSRPRSRGRRPGSRARGTARASALNESRAPRKRFASRASVNATRYRRRTTNVRWARVRWMPTIRYGKETLEHQRNSDSRSAHRACDRTIAPRDTTRRAEQYEPGEKSLGHLGTRPGCRGSARSRTSSTRSIMAIERGAGMDECVGRHTGWSRPRRDSLRPSLRIDMGEYDDNDRRRRRHTCRHSCQR